MLDNILFLKKKEEANFKITASNSDDKCFVVVVADESSKQIFKLV